MLLGGDELGRTQEGNNNAYCQDNETSWFDWERVDEELLSFVRDLIALRREHPVFRRRRWFHGRAIRGTPDVGWAKPDGGEMADEDWDQGFACSLAIYLNGDAIPDHDDRGQPVADASFLLLLRAEGKSWSRAHRTPVRSSSPIGSRCRPGRSSASPSGYGGTSGSQDNGETTAASTLTTFLPSRATKVEDIASKTPGPRLARDCVRRSSGWRRRVPWSSRRRRHRG